MARTKFSATQEQRSVVSALVAFGIPQEQILSRVINPQTGKPISINVLKREFKRELAEGLVDKNIQVAGTLYNAAIRGNVTAMIFWLKTRGQGQRVAKTEVEVDAKDTAEAFAEAVAKALGDADKKTTEKFAPV